MKRSGPIKSRQRREWEARIAACKEHPISLRRAERTATYVGRTTGPAPKEELLQHQGYMAIVRTFACERCGRPGPSEFAHADFAKGTGIKSDCRDGTSLCGYRSPEDPGCHWLVGTKRIYPQAQRRELEKQWSALTRARVLRLDLWPKSLPQREPNP